MNFFELGAIVCFLLAGAANDNCIGGAMLLVALSGICAVIAAALPKHRKKVRRK